MKNIPDEKQIEELLENVSLDATSRLEMRLAAAPWTPRAIARRRLMNLSAVAVLLFALFVTIVPQGRAFAQRIFLFFRTTEEKSFPIPTEQVYALPPTETPAPTYILPLEPAQPVVPTQTQAPDGSCTSPEAQSGYFCQIQAVEAQAGFDAKELPQDPRGMKFSRAAFDPNLNAIYMEFTVTTGGGSLYFAQGVGDFPATSNWEKVPADGVKQVTVNGQYAELASGTFVVYPNATEAVWQPDAAQLRLHWREGNRWFSLEKMGDPYPIEWMDENEIVKLAETLVDERPADQILPVDPENLTSVEAAEELAGFDVPAPTLLPEGYELKRVAWRDGAVHLLYGPESSPESALMISMGPVANSQVGPCVECPAGATEEVQVGPWNGWYMHGAFNMGLGSNVDPTPTPVWEPDARHWGLSWNTDTLWVSMSFWGVSNNGGEMNRETLVRIAESLQ